MPATPAKPAPTIAVGRDAPPEEEELFAAAEEEASAIKWYAPSMFQCGEDGRR